MLTDKRKTDIENLAININRLSEKYQLIHATFAIEKLFKDKLQEFYSCEFARLREKIRNVTNAEEQEALYKEAEELRSESNKRIKIRIDYIAQMREDSARVTRTPSNNFIIVLPKCMENIRKENGEIDLEMLGRLRKLMAHELGHVVLHSGILDFQKSTNDSDFEEEADYFAEKLLALRKENGKEMLAS